MLGSHRAVLLLSAVLLGIADSTPLWAQQPVLDVWTPRRTVSHYGSRVTPAFIAKLEAASGRRVRLNASPDIKAMYAACARHLVDHLILTRGEANHIIERYGYRLIAYGESKVAFYVRSGEQRPTEALARVGYLLRMDMDTVARRELPIPGIERKLLGMPNDQSGLQALFNGQIDGLIIRPNIVEQLAPPLRKQLKLRQSLKSRGRVAFIVSPTLDPEVARRLQALYLSDDPFIRWLFVDMAGVPAIVAPPDTTLESESEPERSASTANGIDSQ